MSCNIKSYAKHYTKVLSTLKIACQIMLEDNYIQHKRKKNSQRQKISTAISRSIYFKSSSLSFKHARSFQNIIFSSFPSHVQVPLCLH